MLGGQGDFLHSYSRSSRARKVHRLEPFTLYFCLASCSHIDTLYTRLFIVHRSLFIVHCSLLVHWGGKILHICDQSYFS
ncbi:hypothetical protein M6B38_299470 [Iris pallida]|uniref:Uncharacterized protein n=1 Tax=Iris pallida TaxID=29817 RepID=A0AAX6HRQ6_IRIPA|nr:hypothetical protein M6B38_299470 [Iris pallida]